MTVTDRVADWGAEKLDEIAGIVNELDELSDLDDDCELSELPDYAVIADLLASQLRVICQARDILRELVS